MLQARCLEALRDDRVLFTALDFTLAAGEVLQVAGPNGAGKTTLLNMVAGLAPLEAGSLLWKGQAVADDPAAFRRVFSCLGHAGGLKLAMTPLENLAFLLRLRGQPVDAGRLWAALKQAGLRGYEDVPLARLSAGQKRRAALARLFVEDSVLWILDEPFTAIDKAGVLELENWLRAHADAGGMVLLTTHHAFSAGFPATRLDLSAYRPGRAA